mgnify:FL=1
MEKSQLKTKKNAAFFLLDTLVFISVYTLFITFSSFYLTHFFSTFQKHQLFQTNLNQAYNTFESILAGSTPLIAQGPLEILSLSPHIKEITYNLTTTKKLKLYVYQ